MLKQEKQIAQFLNELWNNKSCQNKSPLYSIFSNNLIVNSPIGKSIGVDMLRLFTDKWLMAFPDIKISEIKIKSFEHVVISNWKSTAIHENQFNNIPSTGKKIHYSGETSFYFLEKKIVRYSCHVDLSKIYQQLGYFYKQEEYDGQALIFKNKKLLIQKLKEVTNNRLTSREIQSLSLNLIGFSAKQIGIFLSISNRTAETHLHKALHELGCFSKLQYFEKIIEKSMLHLWQDLSKILIQEWKK